MMMVMSIEKTMPKLMTMTMMMMRRRRTRGPQGFS
jgi:hypothetical protein